VGCDEPRSPRNQDLHFPPIVTRPLSFAHSSPEEDFGAFGLEIEDRLSESLQSLAHRTLFGRSQ
jgi:hypothetical protein